jgi:hypothetical protein
VHLPAYGSLTVRAAEAVAGAPIGTQAIISVTITGLNQISVARSAVGEERSCEPRHEFLGLGAAAPLARYSVSMWELRGYQ